MTKRVTLPFFDPQRPPSNVLRTVMADGGWQRHGTAPLFLSAITTLFGAFAYVWCQQGVVESTFLQQRTPQDWCESIRLRYPQRRIEFSAEDFWRVAQCFQPHDNPLPLLVHGTFFAEQVWRALLGVGCGQVISYGQLAKLSGHPRSARAVGHALATNPLPWLIPCHRVIHQTRHLGHYQYGSDLKLAMLNWEQQLSKGSGQR